MKLNELEELYNYIKLNGRIPAINSTMARFKSGKYMGLWLRRHTQEIELLAENGNETAQGIMEFVKNQIPRNILTRQEKLKELYEMSKTMSFEEIKMAKFKDGTKVYKWMNAKREFLRQEKENGNVYAQAILKLYCKRNAMTFDEKLKEVLEYVMLSNKLPANGSNVAFSDGTNMPMWIHNYEKRLIEMSKSGNKEAKLIEKYMQKRSRVKYLNINTKIDEFYEYIIKNKKFPSTKLQFSNNTNMYCWYYVNKSKIEQKAEKGNLKAEYIIKYATNLRNQKKEISFEQKISELYEYIIKNKKIPVYYSHETFSDGSYIALWSQAHRNKIKNLSDKDEKIKLIAEYLIKRERTPKNIRIKELLQFYNTKGYLPQKDSNETFKDGKLIGKWLNKNKYSIYEKSIEGDKDSILILNALLESNYSILKLVKAKTKEEEYKGTSKFNEINQKLNNQKTLQNQRKLKK